MKTWSAFINGWWNWPGSFSRIVTSGKVSLGLVERLNSKIHILLRRACNYRDEEHLKLDVFVNARYHHCRENDMIQIMYW
ncbi:MAG: hypothetical protein BMS9Abin26_1583 [Gammaproteobacteria bacterium]|nr:MAG: hypothetical protein BMS9Abin26_1583 [Gammaproteobacteria bacterium]